jgi:acyl-CoA thioesterase
MTITRFDRDTAVERVSPGRYRGSMDRGWWIINGPNGGYIAAIVLRAMVDEIADPTRSPRSFTLHYLRPPTEGAVEIEVTVEREGRTLSTASARLFQEGRLMVIALGAFATPRASFEFSDREPPRIAPPEQCVSLKEKFGGHIELRNRYDQRMGVGDGLGSGSAHALIGGWIRCDEPRVVDALAVTAFTDAFPPAVFTRAGGREGLGPVPTVDLSIHFRSSLPLAGADPSDYCAAVFSSVVSREGFVEEDGEIWSAGGVLLAQSRQLALLGTPK